LFFAGKGSAAVYVILNRFDLFITRDWYFYHSDAENRGGRVHNRRGTNWEV